MCAIDKANIIITKLWLHVNIIFIMIVMIIFTSSLSNIFPIYCVSILTGLPALQSWPSTWPVQPVPYRWPYSCEPILEN